jgi:hypothetical protein
MGLAPKDPSPISAPVGQMQEGVDPMRLQPAREDLVRSRLEYQRTLLLKGLPRLTPIQVSREGVIADGHHAIRAAAEQGNTVSVLVSALTIGGRPGSIMDLPVR